VTQRRRLTSSAFIIAIVTTLVLPGPVSAAETSEVDSLRNEVRQLQSQLHALRSAVAEATELEGRRSANLAKQMREPQGAALAETLPPTTDSEPPSRSRGTAAVAAPDAADDKPARSKHRRKHTSRSRSKASKVQTRN
jgi:outer membrane murein-binding lipoprotein Lpp